MVRCTRRSRLEKKKDDKHIWMSIMNDYEVVSKRTSVFSASIQNVNMYCSYQVLDLLSLFVELYSKRTAARCKPNLIFVCPGGTIST